MCSPEMPFDADNSLPVIARFPTFRFVLVQRCATIFLHEKETKPGGTPVIPPPILNPLFLGYPGRHSPGDRTVVRKYFYPIFRLKKGLPTSSFHLQALFIEKERVMEKYLRERKRMPEEQRRKISEALKGKKKDAQTRKAISRGLHNYWSKVVWEGDE